MKELTRKCCASRAVSVSAALDELTYRAPQEAAGEPIDYARLLNANLHASEPT